MLSIKRKIVLALKLETSKSQSEKNKGAQEIQKLSTQYGRLFNAIELLSETPFLKLGYLNGLAKVASERTFEKQVIPVPIRTKALLLLDKCFQEPLSRRFTPEDRENALRRLNKSSVDEKDRSLQSKLKKFIKKYSLTTNDSDERNRVRFFFAKRII